MMDPYLCFARQALLSSSVNPIYLFTGVLAEVFFSLPGHGDLTPANNGLWDPASDKKKILYRGDGDEVWNFTAERDAAAYSIELVTREGAERGGFFRVHSGMYSPLDVKAIYQQVRGREVEAWRLGSMLELRDAAFNARRMGDVSECWRYIGFFYQLFTVEGTWTWTENETVCDEFPGVERTSLRRWLEENPEV